MRRNDHYHVQGKTVFGSAEQPCMGRAGRLRPARAGLFVKPPIVAPSTLVEAGQGVAFRLALITLLILAMLILTLLNVSAVERIVSRDAQGVVPPLRGILSIDPAGPSSSSDAFALAHGQLGIGGCQE